MYQQQQMGGGNNISMTTSNSSNAGVCYAPVGPSMPRGLKTLVEQHKSANVARLEAQAYLNRDGNNPPKPTTVVIYRKVPCKNKLRKDWDIQIHEVEADSDHPDDRVFAAQAYIVSLARGRIGEL